MRVLNSLLIRFDVQFQVGKDKTKPSLTKCVSLCSKNKGNKKQSVLKNGAINLKILGIVVYLMSS